MSKLLSTGVIAQEMFDSITLNYVNRMVTKPSIDHIKLIDNFVKSCKSILLKADVVYLMNINNTTDSFRNLVKDEHNGVISGSTLVYDDYWGWSNPSGDTLIDTDYIPSIDGVNYTRNNAGYACDIQGSNQPSVIQYVMGSHQSTSNRTSFNVNTAVGTINYIVNDGSNNSVGEVAFRSGYNYGSRESSTIKKFRNRNILDITHNTNSTALSNVNWLLFGIGVYDNYIGNLSFVYIGASLTDEENKILDDAINDYLIQCLFLKYGHDNWGVKMAKSYFFDLHNFEKYEAWEVYEFIKRHQPNYQDLNLIPLDSSKFDTSGGTTWWQVGKGTISYNSTDKCLQLNSTTTGYLYKTSSSLFNNAAIGYRVKFKYRSATYTSKLLVYVGTYSATFTNNCLSQWQQYDSYITGVPSTFYIVLAIQHKGIIELDDIEIIPEGYYYKQFSGNTIANHIMLFKAGGNLNSNIWAKTGDILRWNQDGIITTNNTMPAYTRGGNLGIVTVTTTDSFNNVNYINLTQTNSSVNSFYGNFPQFEKLKTTSFSYLFGSQNRIKFNFLNGDLILRSFLFDNITYRGYVKIDLNKYVGAILNGYFTISNPTEETDVYGNLSLYTNEFNSNRQLIITGLATKILSLSGTLNNWVYGGTYTQINIQYTNLTGGLLNWNKNLDRLYLGNNQFTTEAVDAQLKAINDYFATTNPIKNLTINLSGTNMGIPTGGASNTDLLGIIAKHTAAGFTATITVRTS